MSFAFISLSKQLNLAEIYIKMVEQDHGELTQAEAELYDRQIRLWGLENQKR